MDSMNQALYDSITICNQKCKRNEMREGTKGESVERGMRKKKGEEWRKRKEKKRK